MERKNEEKLIWLDNILKNKIVTTTNYVLVQVVALELHKSGVTSQDIAAFLDKIEPKEIENVSTKG